MLPFCPAALQAPQQNEQRQGELPYLGVRRRLALDGAQGLLIERDDLGLPGLLRLLLPWPLLLGVDGHEGRHSHHDAA